MALAKSVAEQNELQRSRRDRMMGWAFATRRQVVTGAPSQFQKLGSAKGRPRRLKISVELSGIGVSFLEPMVLQVMVGGSSAACTWARSISRPAW